MVPTKCAAVFLPVFMCCFWNIAPEQDNPGIVRLGFEVLTWDSAEAPAGPHGPHWPRSQCWAEPQRCKESPKKTAASSSPPPMDMSILHLQCHHSWRERGQFIIMHFYLCNIICTEKLNCHWKKSLILTVFGASFPHFCTQFNNVQHNISLHTMLFKRLGSVRFFLMFLKDAFYAHHGYIFIYENSHFVLVKKGN